MDITTFANLFSGSPFKPLLQHRDEVLKSLRFLAQQLQGIYVAHYPKQESPNWLYELPHQLEQYEQEVLVRLQRPFIMALPKELVISSLQTQSNLAHVVYRLTERLSHNPVTLQESLNSLMARLCRSFGKAVYQLHQGTIQLDSLSRAGFRRKHSRSMEGTRQQLAIYANEISQDSSALRKKICSQENDLATLDMALLFMTLDDICELTLLMRSMVNQLQPHN